uniref:DUF445 domain-containing protein n=1 Tax=Aplanochytrium stocchinoi TaxID=215587 RepID=A0A7S3LST3_9STRA
MPKVWSMLPAAAKRAICSQAAQESPAVVKGLLADIGEDIEKYFDLEKMVVEVLVNNMEMCNDIFISVSHRELAVIRNSGAWMGGFFGLVQMILWIFWHEWWVLPVLGFAVGSCTNFIALLVIFRPINPINICGYNLHGFFLKRQAEVSKCYGKLIAGKVMTAEHLNKELMCGKNKDLVLALAHKRISFAFDKSVAPLKQGPLSLAVPSTVERALENMKKKIADEIANDMYNLMRELEPYMTEAMDLENLLRTRMSALPNADFEGLLHPIFQEDEPKLVLVGGVLGALLGFLQIRMF